MKLRRGKALLPDLLALFALRKELGIELVPVDPAGTVELAAATGLSGHDASYLWLARRHDAELVTVDKRLAAAAAP